MVMVLFHKPPVMSQAMSPETLLDRQYSNHLSGFSIMTAHSNRLSAHLVFHKSNALTNDGASGPCQRLENLQLKRWASLWPFGPSEGT